MDRLAHLNPPQRLAATTLSGPLLVLAGAGTGKTRVITYRMAELIRSGIVPNRILSVTFTNKAAREMKERTANLLGKKIKAKPMVSTFHSFCVKVLRREIEALGYPKKFAIYDRGDQESAARRALREIKISDKQMKPGDLINRISRWKMAGVSPAFASDNVDNDSDFLAAVAYRKYQTFLKSSGAVDFDDLLLLTIDLFDQFPEVLKRVQGAFDHIQIDEYQDTNGVQFRLIEQLVEPHNNLCVVGDDDQSIYGWRGADVAHILNFHQHFEGTQVVRLEDNYRCTDRILEIANRLVKNNPGRHDKKLIPHKMSGPGVRYFKYQDETVEAESVVKEIAYLIKELGAQPREFAVLFRTNEQPRPLESEFRRQVIPYVIVGGQSFFDRRETRDLMAYLKILANPADEISMRRIINTPARGIGTTTSQKLLERAIRDGRTFWDGMKSRPDDLKLPTRAATAVDGFVEQMDKFRNAAEANPGQLGEIVERMVDEIRYDDEIDRQYSEEDQRTARRASVRELIDSVYDYVKRAEEPSLSDYLEQSALTDRVDESDKDNQLAGNSVKLMTIHASKGLEFPRVYMVGMEEGLLPHKRSVEGTAAMVSEERRLAYVGVTRAQDYLTLSRAMARRKFGKMKVAHPSRFLKEMFEAPPTEAVSISAAAPPLITHMSDVESTETTSESADSEAPTMINPVSDDSNAGSTNTSESNVHDNDPPVVEEENYVPAPATNIVETNTTEINTVETDSDVPSDTSVDSAVIEPQSASPEPQTTTVENGNEPDATTTEDSPPDVAFTESIPDATESATTTDDDPGVVNETSNVDSSEVRLDTPHPVVRPHESTDDTPPLNSGSDPTFDASDDAAQPPVAQ
ncbi:UNVERIFIED_CONTAM: hypothetical protein GTU68_027556 [Idotea baltica]|nr:hypothetical protein [Idotea baltica]